MKETRDTKVSKKVKLIEHRCSAAPRRPICKYCSRQFLSHDSSPLRWFAPSVSVNDYTFHIAVPVRAYSIAWFIYSKLHLPLLPLRPLSCNIYICIHRSVTSFQYCISYSSSFLYTCLNFFVHCILKTVRSITFVMALDWSTTSIYDSRLFFKINLATTPVIYIMICLCFYSMYRFKIDSLYKWVYKIKIRTNLRYK